MPLPGEPLWLDDDQDKALAYMDRLRQDDACPDCGTHPADWVDPVSGRRWREPRWVAEVHECPGCVVVASAVGLAESGGDGKHVRLRATTAADFLDLDDM